VAAGLAKKLPLTAAVQNAKQYLHAALTAAEHLHIGKGSGPVHHFHAFY
jgi:hydroxymethylpyrimidine/phosphomethylpyrimidine kinase